MNQFRLLALTSCALGAAIGCQIIFGYEDFSGGGSLTDACQGLVDPGEHGPAMVAVARRNGSCFWIDSTEVTIADYAEFLAEPAARQSGACAWNSAEGGAGGERTQGFSPSQDCSRLVERGIALDGGEPDSRRPMTCVDWCDALAFCQWAGKDLCRDDRDSLASHETSDWFAACAGAAEPRLYGCEGDCQPRACNGDSAQVDALDPAGAHPDCAVSGSGDGSIVDLSGNAEEWTAWCAFDTEEGSTCAYRGGSYDDSDSALECTSSEEALRWRALPTLGFRCCAEGGFTAL
jgi:formylglycine-generating enzyme required for sulfatase activity